MMQTVFSFQRSPGSQFSKSLGSRAIRPIPGKIESEIQTLQQANWIGVAS